VNHKARIVVDTNVLISRLLLPPSVSGRAISKAVQVGQLLVSIATMDELAVVLGRAKFDPYLAVADRQEFVRLLGRIAEMVPIVRRVRACRDPRDDRFLEVAVNGRADLIITGDGDLLELDPFMGIAILRPAAYLAGAS
jgi:putative PIN family toxin of toxin-antitoxin system